MPSASGVYRRVLVLGLGLAGLSLVALMAWLGLRGGIRSGEEKAMPSSFRLEDGPAVERELAREAQHEYTIPALAGEYLLVSAEQLGVDVRLELSLPGTSRVVAVDTPGGPEGFERVSLIAEAEGEWHLVVLADVGEQDPGARYAISVERRAATAEDRRLVTGEYALADGEDLRRKGKYAEAETRYAEALEIATEIGDLKLAAKAQHRIGWVRRASGESAAAVEPLRVALDLAAEAGDLQTEAMASTDLGSILANQWSLAEAEQMSRRALACWQELGRVDGIADAWHVLGETFRLQGRAEESRTAFEQALALNPLMSAPARARRGATFRFSLGQMQLALAEYSTARDLFAGALSAWKDLGEVKLQSDALAKLAEIAAFEGQIDMAKSHFRSALELATSAKYEKGIAIAENGLGEALIRAKELELARDLLEAARSRFKTLGVRYGEAIALMNLGRSWQAGGDDEKAMALHTEALELMSALGDRQGIASNRYALARSSFRRGDLVTARRDLDIAIAEVENLRKEALVTSSRISYFGSRQDYFDLDLVIRLAERAKVSAEEWNRRAFEATERRRARSLLDLLGDSSKRVRHGADPEMLAEERRAQDRLNGLESRRRSLVDQESPAVAIAEVEVEERTAFARLEGIRAELRKANPRRAELAEPQPIGLDRARSLLDDRTALLAYSLGAEQSVLWIVRREGVQVVVDLPPRAEIETLARRVTDNFSRIDPGSESPRRSAAAALAKAILPEALKDLRAGRLAIVAEGALQGVPFAALPDIGQPAKAKDLPPPLLVRFEIVQLPSVSALDVLRSEGARRLPVLGGIAVLADPVYSLDDSRVEKVDDAARPRGLNRLPWTYRRLPATGREANEILAVFPSAQRLDARNFAAHRDLVRNGGLRGFRFIHFATHAEVDPGRPDLSGLVFSLVDAQGSPIDGHLRLHEIYDLDLQADLVVLSACSTAIGRETRGEGLESLARGFLSAGVPRLVVSLWPVEDEGTAVLMGNFYRGLIQKGLGPAAALRKAQLELRLDVRFSDPYHWAGFVFLGDWQFPGARKEDNVAAKGDVPIEQLYTGGADNNPTPANPLPGPQPKKRPRLPEPPPPGADEEGFPHGGKGANS